MARLPFDPAWEVHSLGQMNIQCPFCHALHWSAKQLSHSSANNPKFDMCCYQGKISLPALQHIPKDLYNLFKSRDPISDTFHDLILFYNNTLAMTSVGRTIDHSVNDGGGPYSFVMRGELIHRAGSIIPPDGNTPRYAQLYIHDTHQANTNCLNEHNQRNGNSSPLDPQVLNLL